MGYVKAEDVLPEEVLELIRQYIDGELIYIPRKGEKRCWGSGTGIRDSLGFRNETIFRKHLQGMSVHQLAEEYCLSVKSIQRIITNYRVKKEF